jgi:hypothetical protein
MGFKEPVFLVLSRRKVERMTKTVPSLRRGEIVVKLMVTAADSAFREPTLVREIVVTDPFDGIIPDLDFDQPFITEAEAEQIKSQRVLRMAEQLKAQGWSVMPPPVLEQPLELPPLQLDTEGYVPEEPEPGSQYPWGEKPE